MWQSSYRSALLGFAALAVGCARTSSQLTTCQAEKDQLLTTIANQRDANRTLNDKVVSLESRLDQAEKELARAGGTRLSSRPSSAPIAEPVPAKTTPTQSLPWRSPAGKTDSKSAPTDNRRSSTEAGSATAALAALSRRDSRVRYDAAAGAAEVQVPIAFAGPTATLTGEDKQQLDELARLLKSAEAKDLSILVAGAAAQPAAEGDANRGNANPASPRQLGPTRAQAVADYLDRHGIPRERLAVTSAAPRTAGSSASSGVQVFLVDPAATAVGWGTSDQPVRR